MKIQLLILVFILALSCSRNKQEQIESIMQSDEYTIQVHTEGCFGDSDLTYRIFKAEGKKIFEYPTFVGDPTQTSQIILTDEREKCLKEFLIQGLKANRNGYCTSYSSYKVGTFWNSISFDDGDCDLDEYLDRVME